MLGGPVGGVQAGQLTQGARRFNRDRGGREAITLQFFCPVDALTGKRFSPVEAFLVGVRWLAGDHDASRVQQVCQRLRGRNLRDRFKAVSQWQGVFIRPRGALGICKDVQGIAQALDHGRAEHRGVCQLRNAGAQGQQQARQVAAVDGGDVMRTQRLEGLRVVPVIEMLPITLQTVHAVQRRRKPGQQSFGAQVSEIVSGQVGEQRHAHIGRRGAMGNGRPGVFLHVVRWQPVILGPDVLIEERPGLARQQPQEAQIIRRRCEHRLLGCRTEPPSDPGAH